MFISCFSLFTSYFEGSKMNHTTYLHIMDGFHDHNIRFSDVCTLLKHLAFQLRIKGDHFIFSRADIPEIINLQPLGNKTKPYQIRQLRMLFKKYHI